MYSKPSAPSRGAFPRVIGLAVIVAVLLTGGVGWWVFTQPPEIVRQEAVAVESTRKQEEAQQGAEAEHKAEAERQAAEAQRPAEAKRPAAEAEPRSTRDN